MSLALGLGACSSSQPVQESSEKSSAEVDAGTDAVPANHAEEVAPSEKEAPAPESEVAEAKPTGESTDEKNQLQDADSTPAPKETVSTAEVVEEQVQEEGSGVTTHMIRRGDTLMKIAFEVYGDLFKWRSIYESNQSKIKNLNDLPVGETLTFPKPGKIVKLTPKGEKYHIKSGDTLASISSGLYGTTKKWKRIWKNNSQLIKDPNRIFAGFFLYYTMNEKDLMELDQYKKGNLTSNLDNRAIGSTQRMPASTSSKTPPVSEPVAANVASSPLPIRVPLLPKASK